MARDSLPQRSIPQTDDASPATSPQVSPRGALRSLPSAERASSPALPSRLWLHITRSLGPFSAQLPGHQQSRHPRDTELSTPGPRWRLTRPHQPRRWLPYSGFTPSWPHHHHQYSCARATWGVFRWRLWNTSSPLPRTQVNQLKHCGNVVGTHDPRDGVEYKPPLQPAARRRAS